MCIRDRYHRVNETFRCSAVIMVLVGAAAFLAFQIFPHQLLEIFQKGDDLYLDFGTSYLRIFMCGTLINGITVLVSNLDVYKRQAKYLGVKQETYSGWKAAGSTFRWKS